MPRKPRRPPLAPPPPPLLRVELYPTQLEATIAALDAAPSPRSGYTRISRQRARARLAAALAGVELHRLEGPVERLAALVGGARSRAFRELAASRIRALTAVALVWRACEELPPGPTRDRLLDAGAVDEPRWMADALDALAAAGLRVELPGDEDHARDPLPGEGEDTEG